MSVHIIGSGDASAAPEPLPRPDLALPGPETADPVTPVLEDGAVIELLAHPDPVVRGFGVEQARERTSEAIAAALLARLDDDDPYVFGEALAVVAERRLPHAEAKVAELFAAESATEERAAALGTAYGRLAPERIAEAVREKGRLDDRAFGPVATALAVAGGDEVVAFFKKALGRAGMLNPARRRSLFTAALVSGDVGLCRRVLGDAVGDSNVEAPEGATFPSRAAVASLGGLPDSESRIERGDALYDRVREVLEEDAAPALADGGKALKDALAKRRVADVLRALEPLTSLELLAEALDDEELGTLPQRRQGFLTALVARARDFEHLEIGASSIFLAAAAQAVSLVVSAGYPEASSEAMTSLAKALGVEPEALSVEDTADLAARFEAMTPRDMRRVHTILSRQAFRRAATLRRFTAAVAHAGHGVGFLEAVAESGGDDVFFGLVLGGLADAPEDAETTVLEMLEEETLGESASLAISLAERLRTERVALAVGRRFFDLREVDKTRTARAAMYSGDARLLPLLESRAFPHEPEEAAWVILSLVHGAPLEGKLEEAMERVRSRRGGSTDELEVELRCEHCHEVGTYSFARAYVDPEAKDEWGDPAFVGDTTCKACGAQDSLRPTPRGGQVLTAEMLSFIEAMQRGEATSPRVTPSVTTIGGEKVGLSEALRRMNARIEESPTAIRPRLERARLRMVLRREGLHEDLAAVRAEDPDAVEASLLEATSMARDDNPIAALKLLTNVHARLRDPANPPRIYDAGSLESVRNSVEDLMLEMAQQGLPVPKDVDLEPAVARRNAHAAAAAEAAQPPPGSGRRR
ncbi:MAG: hypothetical protein AAFZ18_05355 [Myxococcota bacterium]